MNQTVAFDIINIVLDDRFTDQFQFGRVHLTIACHDGWQWRPLDTGLGGTTGEYTYACASAVYAGHLITCGHFATAGGVPCNYIARWDSQQWHAMGSGMNDVVHAFTVYNGQLVAGGSFTNAGSVVCNHIACWDGYVWAPLGRGVDGSDAALPRKMLALQSPGASIGHSPSKGIYVGAVAGWW